MASVQSTEAGAGTYAGTYTLYYFPFSLYSLMAKTAYVLGRSTAGDDLESSPLFNVRLVNMHTGDHIAEDYLKNINKKGEVPALIGGTLSAPLADSMDIVLWLCKAFPALLPSEHAQTIRKLMDQQKDVNAFSLTVRDEDLLGKPFPPSHLDGMLAGDDISPEYRQLVEFKRDHHNKTQANSLLTENVQLAEQRARDFLSEIEQLLVKYGDDKSPWIFGSNVGPTALDARTLPFVARVLDVDRKDLVPERVQEYAKRAMASPQWQDVTYGRPTMWNVSFGHVKNFAEFQ